VIPGVGTAAGAVIGGGIGLVSGLLANDPEAERRKEEDRQRLAFQGASQALLNQSRQLAMSRGQALGQGFYRRGIGDSPLAASVIANQARLSEQSALGQIAQSRFNLENQLAGQQRQDDLIRGQQNMELLSAGTEIGLTILSDSELRKDLGDFLGGLMGGGAAYETAVPYGPGLDAFGEETQLPSLSPGARGGFEQEATRSAFSRGDSAVASLQSQGGANPYGAPVYSGLRETDLSSSSPAISQLSAPLSSFNTALPLTIQQLLVQRTIDTMPDILSKRRYLTTLLGQLNPQADPEMWQWVITMLTALPEF